MGLFERVFVKDDLLQKSNSDCSFDETRRMRSNE